jgi:hypothetical protein
MEVSMKRYLVYTLALFVSSACSQDKLTGPSSIGSSSTTSATTQAASPAVPVNYRAHLNGREVVPVIETLAQGQAIFQLSRDGTELSFKVIASNIANVTGAHIHIGAVGLRGPLAILLMSPLASGRGRTDGVLATGTIRAADLFGPLAGQPLSALIDAIKAGNVYVDVPTNDGIAPPNTGPGDFPGGELRGQVR